MGPPVVDHCVCRKGMLHTAFHPHSFKLLVQFLSWPSCQPRSEPSAPPLARPGQDCLPHAHSIGLCIHLVQRLAVEGFGASGAVPPCGPTELFWLSAAIEGVALGMHTGCAESQEAICVSTVHLTISYSGQPSCVLISSHACKVWMPRETVFEEPCLSVSCKSRATVFS